VPARVYTSMKRTLTTLAVIGGLLAIAAPASAQPAGVVVDGPFTAHAPTTTLSWTFEDILITSVAAPPRGPGRAGV
jgi:hypothetical protein